jgi:antitoxin ParD1/3/4
MRLKNMSITLTSEQEQFVQEKLQTGKYNNVNDIITEAFELLKEKDKNYQEWLEQTKTKVEIGLEQANNRKLINGQEAINQLKTKYNQSR